MRPTRPTPRAPCSSTSTPALGRRAAGAACAFRRAMLPEVQGQRRRLRHDIDPSMLGAALPIAGIAGDQQAALVGQACFAPGMIKSTYGTGCFVLLQHRRDGRPIAQPPAHHRRLSPGRQADLRARGQHLRRRRRGAVAARRAEADRARPATARRSPHRSTPTGGVYLVPAFTGLGAPYWDPDARGAILGLTRGQRRGARSSAPRSRRSATRPAT